MSGSRANRLTIRREVVSAIATPLVAWLFVLTLLQPKTTCADDPPKLFSFPPFATSKPQESVATSSEQLRNATSVNVECGVRLQLILDRPLWIQGELNLNQARATSLRNLSMEAGTTGAFHVVTEADGERTTNRLIVSPRQSVDRLGFEFQLHSARDEVLQLHLQLNNKQAPQNTIDSSNGSLENNAALNIDIDIPVNDILSGVVDQRVANGVRLWVGRPGGDAFRVKLGQGRSMTFNASEELPLKVDLLASPGLAAKTLSELKENFIPNDEGTKTYQNSLRSYELEMEIARDATGVVVWQKSVPIDPALHSDIFAGKRTQLFDGLVSVPNSEGVYTLRTRIMPAGAWRMVERLANPELLTRPSLLTRPDLLIADKAIVERATQFVVLEPLPPPVDTTPLREVAHWTPSQRNWFGMDASLIYASSLKSDQPIELIKQGDLTVARLAPDSQFSQPIKIAERGQPHILIVRYLRDQPVKMTVAIRQKDPTGNWATLGIDTAVVDDWSLDHYPLPMSTNGSPVDGAKDSDESWIAEHRVLFWPNSDQPLLILRNENSRADLRIESISIQAGPARLAGGLSKPAVNDAINQKPRLAAVYLDKPLLADAFGCDRQLDPSGRIALDDWTTFLQAGNRLVDYVQASGANAAVISVVSEGCTLFPTDLLASTPRYDTGLFFADGRDPIKKDILDLFCRLFQRAGLKLVLSVEFGTPLPELEQHCYSTGKPNELAWVDHIGRNYLTTHPTARGVGNYYNILDTKVEEQLQNMIGEILDRYGKYSSLAGIGLQIGSNSMLQLPPPSFGRDPTTLQAAANTWKNDVQRRLASDPSAANIVPAINQQALPSSLAAMNAWLDGDGYDFWLRWRANRLTSVFTRTAEKLSDIPLFLITADYRPANGDIPGGDALQFGLDWPQLASIPNVVPLRLIRRRKMVEHARRIEDSKINEDVVWNEMLNQGVQSRLFANSLATSNRSFNNVRDTSHTLSDVYSGGLLYTPPEPMAVNVQESANSSRSITLFPQATPANPQYRRDMAQFLDMLDSQVIFVGGWTPTVAPEPVTKDFFQKYSALPWQRFQDVEPSNAKSAVVKVRQLRTEHSLWIYAVNTCNWSVNLSLWTDAAAGTTVRSFGENQESWRIGIDQPERSGANSSGLTPVDGLSNCWAGQVRPGQLVVLQILGPTRSVARWTATPTIDPMPEIAARIDDLTARVSILGQPREHGGLTNGGFEQLLSASETLVEPIQIEGWMRTQHPPDCVEVTKNAAEGSQALILKTDETPGARTWLLSTPLEVPETGRLAVSIRAKAQSGNPTLRLAVEGRVGGAALRHSVNVQPAPAIPRKTAETINPEKATTTDWPDETYWLYVTDIPDSTVEDLRIAIDLVSPGQVAIDDVQFFDFFFTQQERDSLQRQTFVAAERLRKGDPVAANRLLDSHWARYLRWLEMPFEDGRKAADSNSHASQTSPPTTDVSPATTQPPLPDHSQSGQSWRNSNAPSVPSTSPSSTPSIADRIRQYLPAPLRF